MKIGKLCLAGVLAALPAMASAQVSVGVNVGINAGETYDTVAPGDPVASVDVFYDQLSPYGTWVDEPDVGRVFVPEADGYVPYTNGYWQYTNLGFVWVSSEPHAWATAHYGRWAYSNNFGRWYWAPDTEWGPAWVEWRQTGSDFGWAPLPPAVVVRAGWQPPVESWHYCGAAHVLDRDVARYYEPRTRVVVIHREARPIEHYTTISNVKVVVGPHPQTLRERHVDVRPVKVEARTVGRWTPAEAHAQVERAREHRETFEVANQKRIESNAKIRTAQVKVIEAHPQLKAQVEARARVENRAEPGRPDPKRDDARRPEPARTEVRREEPKPEAARPEAKRDDAKRPEPGRPEMKRDDAKRPEPGQPEPARPEVKREDPKRPEAARPEVKRGDAKRPEPARPEMKREEPKRPEPARPEAKREEPKRPEPARPEVKREEPKRPEPARPEVKREEPKRPEPAKPEARRDEPERKPEPARVERPAPPPKAEPARPPERAQPARPEPHDRGGDRKEPDHH
jgi:hypothetical protein